MDLYYRFQDRFGTAGVVIAVIALIFALGGSAYALSGAEKTLIKKEAKKWGKKFAKTGSQGPQGPQGVPGANGKDGTNGTDGKDGSSVASSVEPKGANCAEGGSKFVAGASTTYACNGKEGKTGSPWTAGGTLPSGESLYGQWALPVVGLEAFQIAAISFGIPLAESPTLELLEEGESETTNCPGTAEEPEAAEGFLCVYTLEEENISTFLEEATASTVGAKVRLLVEEGGTRVGTWAVTAD